MRALVVAAAVSVLAACIPEDGPMMEPGRDCGECHGGGDERGWSVSGTVYARPDAAEGDGVQDARVLVTDANGRRLTLTSNQAGNFYTAEKLVFPLTVAVERGGEREAMEAAVQDGSCNRCHAWPPAEPEVAGRVSFRGGAGP